MESRDKDLEIIKNFKDVACSIAEEVHNRTGLVYKENSACAYHRFIDLCETLDYPDGHHYCYGMGFRYYKKRNKHSNRVFNIRLYIIDVDTYLCMGTALKKPKIFTGSVDELTDMLTDELESSVSVISYKDESPSVDVVKNTIDIAIDITDKRILSETSIDNSDGFVKENGKNYVRRSYGNFLDLLNRISGTPLRIEIKLWYFDNNHVKCPVISDEPIENSMFISKVYEYLIRTYSLNRITATEVTENKLTLSNGATIEIDIENNCSVIKDLKRCFILKIDTIHIGNDIVKYLDYYYYLRGSNGEGILKYFKRMFNRLSDVDSNSKVALLECDISRLSKCTIAWDFKVTLSRENRDIVEDITVVINNNIILAKFGDSKLKDAYEAIDEFCSKCLGDSKETDYSDFPDSMRLMIDKFKSRFIGEISSYRYIKIKKWSGFEYLAILSIGNKHIHISSVDSYSSFRIGYIIGSSKITGYQIKKNTSQLKCDIENVLDKIDGLVSEALKLG